MGLEAWTRYREQHRRAIGLLGLVVTFTGVTMVLNPTHWKEMEWVGIPLVVAGLAILAWAAQPNALELRPVTHSLGSRLIHWLTLRGRLVPWFPAAGIGLIAVDLLYNFLLSSSPELLTEDIFVLLTAASLLAYGFIPKRYGRERDFVLLFFIGLDFLLIVPLLVVRQIAGSVGSSVDVYSWNAIAPELGAILSILGVANSVHSVSGFTAPGLTFTPVQMTRPVTLVISTSCSGIYSFGIFASAYAAFLLTEYEHQSRRLWIILGLGFLASYSANLLRMVVIVLIGYYMDSAQTDLQNLLLAHSYAGWIIFLGWLGVFWTALFRLWPQELKHETHTTDQTNLSANRWQAVCRICSGSLSPSIPAVRCSCSALMHQTCLKAADRCPACGQDSAQQSDQSRNRHGNNPSIMSFGRSQRNR